MAVKKLRKSSGFVIYLNFKDSVFTAVKRVSFLSKMVYKRVRRWTSGQILPVCNFLECPLPGVVVSTMPENIFCH